MTMRLSHSSLTGMFRTLVAVGTESEMSMFFAVAAPMPRSTVKVGSSVAAGAAGFAASFGTGLLAALAGSAFAVSALAGSGLAGSALAGSAAFGAGASVFTGAAAGAGA